MNNDAMTLLTALAGKLGTTTEYLWDVLVRQAPISAITSLLVISLLTYILYRSVKYVQSKKVNSEDDEEYSAELVRLLWFVVVVLAIIVVISNISLAHNVMNGLFNPEYWA